MLRVLGWGGIRRWQLSLAGFILRGSESVLRWIVVMDAQFCGYTKNAELYTINGKSVWNVKHILIKLFQKNKKQASPPPKAGQEGELNWRRAEGPHRCTAAPVRTHPFPYFHSRDKAGPLLRADHRPCNRSKWCKEICHPFARQR